MYPRYTSKRFAFFTTSSCDGWEPRKGTFCATHLLIAYRVCESLLLNKMSKRKWWSFLRIAVFCSFLWIAIQIRKTSQSYWCNKKQFLSTLNVWLNNFCRNLKLVLLLTVTLTACFPTDIHSHNRINPEIAAVHFLNDIGWNATFMYADVYAIQCNVICITYSNWALFMILKYNKPGISVSYYALNWTDVHSIPCSIMYLLLVGKVSFQIVHLFWSQRWKQ